MKRLLIFVLVIGMIAGLSTVSFAIVPFTVEVDSNDYGGTDYLDGLPVSQFTVGETYTFTVVNGAWGDWWGAEGWFWSLNIYDPLTGEVKGLGDSNPGYGSPEEALNAYANDYVSITVGGDAATGAGEGTGTLWFYVPDSSRWNNYGSVTVLVTPEPVSFILFIAGGLALTGRVLYRNRKKGKISA